MLSKTHYSLIKMKGKQAETLLPILENETLNTKFYWMYIYKIKNILTRANFSVPKNLSLANNVLGLTNLFLL